MATKRRIEITVETEQVAITSEETNISTWCADCQSHVLMISLGQAAILSGLSWREVVRKTDTYELHCYEPDGRLLICLASLAQWLRRAEQPTLLLPPINLNLLEMK